MKRVITISQVVVKGKNGKPRYLKGPEGINIFCREVEEQESLAESVNHTFEDYGLDTSELEKVLVKVEDEENIINIWYRLEVDPLSLLEFLVSVEGRESGLELGEEEN